MDILATKWHLFFALLYFFLTSFFSFIRVIVDGRVEFEDPNTMLKDFFRKYKNKIILGQLLSFGLYFLALTFEFSKTNVLDLVLTNIFPIPIPKVAIYPLIGFFCQYFINKYKTQIENNEKTS